MKRSNTLICLACNTATGVELRPVTDGRKLFCHPCFTKYERDSEEATEEWEHNDESGYFWVEDTGRHEE